MNYIKCFNIEIRYYQRSIDDIETVYTTMTKNDADGELSTTLKGFPKLIKGTKLTLIMWHDCWHMAFVGENCIWKSNEKVNCLAKKHNE